MHTGNCTRHVRFKTLREDTCPAYAVIILSALFIARLLSLIALRSWCPQLEYFPVPVPIVGGATEDSSNLRSCFSKSVGSESNPLILPTPFFCCL